MIYQTQKGVINSFIQLAIIYIHWLVAMYKNNSVAVNTAGNAVSGSHRCCKIINTKKKNRKKCVDAGECKWMQVHWRADAGWKETKEIRLVMLYTLKYCLPRKEKKKKENMNNHLRGYSG